MQMIRSHENENQRVMVRDKTRESMTFGSEPTGKPIFRTKNSIQPNFNEMIDFCNLVDIQTTGSPVLLKSRKKMKK